MVILGGWVFLIDRELCQGVSLGSTGFDPCVHAQAETYYKMAIDRVAMKGGLTLSFSLSQHSDLPFPTMGTHRGTSLIRNRPNLGPFRRPMPRVKGGS